MATQQGRPLPKFGEWDVNNPASSEGFTVIFNKARNEKKTKNAPTIPSQSKPIINDPPAYISPKHQQKKRNSQWRRCCCF